MPQRVRSTAKPVLLLLAICLAVTGLSAPPVVAQATSDSLGPLTPRDVVYQIITDRFADGDLTNNVPSGFDSALFDDANSDGQGDGDDLKLYQGGDWQGIIDQIPYLQNLGVTAVWISAPYENRDTVIEDQQPDGSIDRYTSYHGYHVRNYFATNDHFGSLSQFESLRDALHANGIKLVIDFVTNHTSRWQNPTRGFSPEDGRLYEPDRDTQGNYVFDQNGEPADFDGDGQVENLLADPNNDVNGWFHGLGDRGSDTSRFGFRHFELGSLADFSHENTQVVEHLEDAALYWRGLGVDGFRHDATLHMNPAFAAGLREAIDASPGGPVTHFGEFFIGRPDPKYDEYQSFPDRTRINNLDFEFYRAATSTFGDFSQSMSDFGNMLLYTSADYDYEHQAVTFIDNHDVTRFRYIQPNDRPFHAALATLLTTRGTPNIYYGTEQYVTSATAGDQDGRVFMEADYAFDQTTTAFQIIQSLSGLRQSSDALAYGQTTLLHSSNDVLVFSRKFFGDEVVVAVNRQPDAARSVPTLTTTLPNGTYADELDGLLFGDPTTITSGQIPGFSLDGGEVSVWSSNPPAPSTPRLADVVATAGRPGNTVDLFGTGLDGSVTVRFGGVAATVVSSSSTELEVLHPAGAPAGPTTITVTKNGSTSNSFDFDVLSGDPNQVVFSVNASTVPGQEVHVVGSIPELGGWDPTEAPEAMFNPNYPEWFLPISVPANTTFEFKFIKMDGAGNVVWESGNNRVFTSSPNPRGSVNTPLYYWQ